LCFCSDVFCVATRHSGLLRDLCCIADTMSSVGLSRLVFFVVYGCLRQSNLLGTLRMLSCGVFFFGGSRR
jgi:hypothetical protein